eukprot:1277220-Prymnesium_polylepis.1
MRTHGGSNPVVPSLARPHAHATSILARSPLPDLGQTSRGSLSRSRSRDAQRAANHRQQAKGSSATRSARQGK